MPLTNYQLLVLEAHLRILRESTAVAAAVTLDELEELLRVYRAARLPATDPGFVRLHSR